MTTPKELNDRLAKQAVEYPALLELWGLLFSEFKPLDRVQYYMWAKEYPFEAVVDAMETAARKIAMDKADPSRGAAWDEPWDDNRLVKYVSGTMKGLRLNKMTSTERDNYISTVRSEAGKAGAMAKWKKENLPSFAKASQPLLNLADSGSGSGSASGSGTGSGSVSVADSVAGTFASSPPAADGGRQHPTANSKQTEKPKPNGASGLLTKETPKPRACPKCGEPWSRDKAHICPAPKSELNYDADFEEISARVRLAQGKASPWDVEERQ